MNDQAPRAELVHPTPTPEYGTKTIQYIDDYLHGTHTAPTPVVSEHYSSGEVMGGLWVIMGGILTVILLRALSRCSSKTLTTIIMIASCCSAFAFWVMGWPVYYSAVSLSLALARIIYMRKVAKADPSQQSWKPPEQPEPEPQPKFSPPPNAFPIPHWFMGMTEKEKKILALALDKAAQPGESEAAWIKFGKSLRGRGVGRS